jgi:hypothetical protein
MEDVRLAPFVNLASMGASSDFDCTLKRGHVALLGRLTFAANLRGLHLAEYQNVKVTGTLARNGPRQVERRS